ncbi:GH13475 [Drosophila grimshawi]|uniref:GH13475 n=1 Tax=Drosophila grimshawi TaxID=7222 RepID=B4JP98_DROGR|nr:GH13475 [Drosophila grimshawi]
MRKLYGNGSRSGSSSTATIPYNNGISCADQCHTLLSSPPFPFPHREQPLPSKCLWRQPTAQRQRVAREERRKRGCRRFQKFIFVIVDCIVGGIVASQLEDDHSAHSENAPEARQQLDMKLEHQEQQPPKPARR